MSGNMGISAFGQYVVQFTENREPYVVPLPTRLPDSVKLVKIISILLIVVLCALGALHAYWGLGGRWPGHDERNLVQLVVGRTRAMRMPGFAASMLVAAALFSAAVLVALECRIVPVGLGALTEKFVHIGFWLVFAVFALRGLAGFIPSIFAYAQGTPFASLNRLFYSPLCLLIAAGFATVGLRSG
jgi:hypothetical protein